ncbi:universal stress protein [Streptomyces aureoverticillatus]|uniref:universal stress protein n=1 Tax=Streptomyces aureoverticillatus TaxID=66871 RepID=UPI0013D936B0|nr:universal stress protein [Streptomyces aureoverticillatus]QIB42757.1 universal stress protein [Streptomyces aureoverticillatus]
MEGLDGLGGEDGMDGIDGVEAAGRVVVGVSGVGVSGASLAALRAGARVARRDGRRLVAVLAWEPPEGEALYLRRPDPEWARHWEREAWGRLDAAFDAVFGGVPVGVEVERTVVRGPAGRVLCGVASRPGDLLVVGARGGRRWRGRVRRYVDGRAGCAVLVVPAVGVPRRLLRRVTVADVVGV